MEPSTLSTYRERVRLVPIEIFTALWAAGLLAHQSKVSFSEWMLVDPVMVVLVALALIRPGARFVLPALAGAQLLSLWPHLPTPPITGSSPALSASEFSSAGP